MVHYNWTDRYRLIVETARKLRQQRARQANDLGEACRPVRMAGSITCEAERPRSGSSPRGRGGPTTTRSKRFPPRRT